MKKATRITLIIATACLALGMIISGIAFAVAGFDVHKLSTSSTYQEQNYTSQHNNYTKIRFDGAAENVRVEQAMGDKIELQYFENDRRSYVIDDVDGVLAIYETHKMLFSVMNFEFPGEHSLVIKVPQAFTGSLELSTASGDIQVVSLKDLSDVKATSAAGNVSIEHTTSTRSIEVGSSSGSIKLRGVSAQSIQATNMSGSCLLDGVSAEAQVKAESVSGLVQLLDVAGSSLLAKSASGDVAGERITASTLSTESTSGSIRVQMSIADTVFAKTLSGDIDFHLKGLASDYAIAAASMSGDARTPLGTPGAQKTISLESTSGDIDLTFIEA